MHLLVADQLELGLGVVVRARLCASLPGSNRGGQRDSGTFRKPKHHMNGTTPPSLARIFVQHRSTEYWNPSSKF